MKINRLIVIATFAAISIVSFLLNQPGWTASPFFDPHGNYEVSTQGCAECHSSHGAQGQELLGGSDQKALCYNCHDGSGSIYNVRSEFGEETVGTSVYASFHPVPGGQQLCTTCHNPHLTNSTTPPITGGRLNQGRLRQ
ncbi:MAG TPA: cytochrome c3 family protein [Bacillota bacterium]|nr:cytochrome c3 family protein [Bacillota bacterium]